MFSILGAHFRKIKTDLKTRCEELAAAIETGDAEKRSAGIWSLFGWFLPRALIWGVGALYYAKKGIVGGYLELLITFYALGFLLSGDAPAQPRVSETSECEVERELLRQRAAEMQETVMQFMFRVIVAVSSFTPILRPNDERDIEIHSTNGENFYMQDDIAIFQNEAETEGEVTPEVEDTLQRELQRYALKYISDYPMLISPEAGGRAPVEMLSVKNCGNRVLIDYVFTSAASIPLIDARRRARVERQQREQHPRPSTADDYAE